MGCQAMALPFPTSPRRRARATAGLTGGLGEAFRPRVYGFVVGAT